LNVNDCTHWLIQSRMPYDAPIQNLLLSLNFALSVLFCLPCIAFGAPPSGMLRHYSTENGLSHNLVTNIIQDQQGMIWIGTQDGLNTFDGYNFHVYTNKKSSAKGLERPFILSLLEDSEGVFWVGTLDGLIRFDQHSQRIQHYQFGQAELVNALRNAVILILEDRFHSLWIVVANEGLAQFNRQTGQATFYRHDPENASGLSSDAVTALYEDRQGTFWIGTEEEGLNRFDRSAGTFTHYRHAPDQPATLSSDKIVSIYEDRAGMLWIGTENGGLNRFDRATQTFAPFYPVAQDDPSAKEKNTITHILEDGQGTLWIATLSGLLCFDRATNRFVKYETDENPLSRLKDEKIFTVYEDRAGMLWIGTHDNGVYTYMPSAKPDVLNVKVTLLDPNDDPDELPDIYAIYEDQEHCLWIGAERCGLTKYDRRSGEKTVYAPRDKSSNALIFKDVYAIYEDANGVLWLGTDRGLNAFDRRSGEVARYVHDSKNPTSVSHDSVISICQDRSGRYWIGTLGGGLNLFDPEKGTFVRYAADSKKPDALNHHEVWGKCSSRSDSLWVGSFGGGFHELTLPPASASPQIVRYQHDPNDSKSLSNDLVFAFYEEEENLWIGTFEGLNKFHKATRTFTHYGRTEGFPQNKELPFAGVFGILPDAEHHLWLSTTAGIVKFDPQREIFIETGIGDGRSFNLGASFKNDAGEMFFASEDTIYAFSPENIGKNIMIPPVILTELTEGDEPVSLEILRQAQGIRLGWRKNFFEFEFAALNYLEPEKNQYAYQLEGFDDAWNYIGTRRFGKYTNLPGGTYHLSLKASNNDGVWNDTGISLPVYVETPPWMTWWAYLLYVLIPAVPAYVYGHYLHTRRRLENAIRLIVEGTASATGTAFFRSLAQSLAAALNVRFVLVAECLDQPRTQARTLAFWTGGEFAENFSYDLSSGLYGEKTLPETMFYRQGVSREFPDDELVAVTDAESYARLPLRASSGEIIGFLLALHDRPLREKRLTLSLLKIFAARAEAELERQQTEHHLKASLQEKEVLLKEIHHRVKNNLQIISSLLGMQAREIHEPALAAIFQQSQHRVKSMAMIHEKLYRSDQLARIDMEPYLSELATYLFNAYGAESRQISVIVHAAQVVLDIDAAIPCAMIVSELVANAIKHAFSNNVGTIDIELKQDALAQHYLLTVMDNGVGYQEKRGGLGLRLVELFAEQLDGQIAISSDGGTQVTITFPVAN